MAEQQTDEIVIDEEDRPTIGAYPWDERIKPIAGGDDGDDDDDDDDDEDEGDEGNDDTGEDDDNLSNQDPDSDD